MKFLYSLLGVYAFMILIVLPPLYLQYQRLDDAEFARVKLDIAVDYAGEGALRQALTLDDISMDVSTGVLATISPRSVASTFAEVLLLNFSITPTEKNVNELLSYVPVMMLTQSTGYYLAEHISDGRGNYPLVFQPQKPFYIDDGTWLWNADIGFYNWVAIKKEPDLLSPEWAMYEGRFKADNGTFSHGGVTYRFPKLSADGIDKSEAMAEYATWINREVNLQIRAALKRYSELYSTENIQSFYIPMGDSNSLVNTIYKSSFIVVVKGITLDGSTKSDLISINGMYADGVDYVVGWEVGNEKRYKRARLINDPNAYLITETNARVFSSQEKAAEAGYFPELNIKD